MKTKLMCRNGHVESAIIECTPGELLIVNKALVQASGDNRWHKHDTLVLEKMVDESLNIEIVEMGREE